MCPDMSPDEQGTVHKSKEESDGYSVDSYEGVEEVDAELTNEVETELANKVETELANEVEAMGTNKIEKVHKTRYPYPCKHGVKYTFVLKGECKFTHTPELKPCKYGADCLLWKAEKCTFL